MNIRVLIAVSSTNPSTQAMAIRVGHTLTEVLGAGGLCVDLHVRQSAKVSSTDEYDAVVVGGSAYAGERLRTAERFVAAHRDTMQHKPVWHFSSGPVGDSPQPGHLVERSVVTPFPAQNGANADWRAVDAWASEIAHELLAARSVSLAGISPG